MKNLTITESEKLIVTLKNRFEKNMSRHSGILWDNVLEKLLNNSNKMWSLMEMEKTGGEPDVVMLDKKSDQYVFYDCSKETPLLRRSLCYDKESLESRKNFKPENNAIDMANEMGIEILSEDQYKYLQSIGEFDLKTSSWLKTDMKTRKLGGAIFGDRRYDRVFIYHNGAESYYTVRGFRGAISI